MLHTETQRTVPCCSYCGELVEYDAEGCEEHPAEPLTTVTLDSSWRTPAIVATATTLTTAQIQTVVAWLNGVKSRGSELTMHERDLLASCVDAQDVRIVKRWRTGAARTIVAAAFNALQRGA